MQEDDFSEIKINMFGFFESKIKKSALFKVKEKVNKKQVDLDKSADKDKAKKEAELKVLIANLFEQRQTSLTTEIPAFLTESAKKAISVNKPMFKVTHPAKFTHGLTPYGGILVNPSEQQTKSYLTTESLQDAYFDITNSNGNLITHARFLMLNIDGKTVYDKLINGDNAWLLAFSKKAEQIKEWEEGLSLWVAKTEDIQDTSRLKQSYFYLSDNSYHLTAPLFSSSLCQAIYEKVRFSTFSQENKKLKTARRNKQYAEGVLVEYPKFAVMNFGGTQPQNISAGNFERHGEAFLLPCSPPHWQSSLKPPINLRSLYEGEFDRRAWKLAKELQLYLNKLQSKKGNMEIRNHVSQLVYQIIDTLLGYVAEIHNIENQSGWSETNCKLKESHKLWLDLHRDDKTFQLYRDSGEWQKEVCKDFGLWLNKKLENKEMVFAKIESSHWAKLLKRQLREFERDIKQAKGVTV